MAKRRVRSKWYIGVALVLLAGAYSYWSISRPLPELLPTKSNYSLQSATPASQLNWPASQAAVGVLDDNILESHGTQTPVPTASTAKVITALMTLKQHPLKLGEQGPRLTITADDVARYKNYVSQDGSVVPVQAGEQISEYQALQALLLPSANNMADKLAEWSYGSLQNYTKSANNYLHSIGAKNTTIGSDASGLSPDTKSTAADMVIIGKLAMQNSVIAQIVDQPTATGIPLTTSVKNVNFLLGTDNIIGIKTGNSDQAGGAFIGASRVKVNGQDKIIVTAVMGAPDLVTSMRQSQALIRSAQANFKPISVIKKGTVLGTYKQPWGGTVTAIASQDMTKQVWNGTPVNSRVNLQKISAQANINQTAGKVFSASNSVDIKLQSAPTKPTIWWRLIHPLN